MHEKLEIKEAIGISPISSALSNSSKSIQSIFFNSKIYRVNRYYKNYTAYCPKGALASLLFITARALKQGSRFYSTMKQQTSPDTSPMALELL
jgi:hypothetical protein